MYQAFNGSWYKVKVAWFSIIERDILESLLADYTYLGTTDLPNGMYRFRRNKYVKIPPRWVGSIPHALTIRKRKRKNK